MPSYFAGHPCSATSTYSRSLAAQLRRSHAHRHIFCRRKRYHAPISHWCGAEISVTASTCAAGRGHRRARFLRRSDRSKRRFWARREDDDQIGFIAARTRAIFGRSCAAEPHLLIEQLGKDEAITDADADASAAAGGVGISRSTTRPGRTTRRSPGTRHRRRLNSHHQTTWPRAQT
jgi:hypothetical protein